MKKKHGCLHKEWQLSISGSQHHQEFYEEHRKAPGVAASHTEADYGACSRTGVWEEGKESGVGAENAHQERLSEPVGPPWFVAHSAWMDEDLDEDIELD
jgi:hypothetical protein